MKNKTYILFILMVIPVSLLAQFTGGFGRGDTTIIVTNTYLTCDLTINSSFTICQGESVTVGSNIYTETNTYIDTLQAINGCDSIVVTNLTVNPLPPVPIISQNGDTLFSTALVGNQWYDSIEPISCAINNYFVPDVTGYYYVIATDSIGCVSDTSEIVYVMINFLNILQKNNELNIFPNPFNFQTTITFSNQKHSDYLFTISNITGKVIRFYYNVTSNKFIIYKEDLKPGMYFVELSGKNVFRGKMMVE